MRAPFTKLLNDITVGSVSVNVAMLLLADGSIWSKYTIQRINPSK